MNWQEVAREWNEIKWHVRTTWEKLTDEDLVALHGRRSELVDAIKERYGVPEAEAESQIASWIAKITPDHMRKTDPTGVSSQQSERPPR